MANDFILVTDDSSDLSEEFYADNDIGLLHLSISIDDATYTMKDMKPAEFYSQIRAGKKPVTSAVNMEEARDLIESHVQAGKDVLYIAFSSGLSATYQNGKIAVDELSEKYPDRKIIIVDSLCASLGQGLLLFMANRLKQSGASIDEVADWALNNRLKVAHYVMADDLMHLHRGGRISKASAIAGSMLGIKPIIQVNDEGKLVAADKVRGKKQALTALVDKIEKCAGGKRPDYFTISHADCLEDAKFTAELMKKRFGIKNYMINYVGPVIGSHTGTGTIALFAIVEHR